MRRFSQTRDPETGAYVREIEERRGGKLLRTERCRLPAERLDDAVRARWADPPCPHGSGGTGERR